MTNQEELERIIYNIAHGCFLEVGSKTMRELTKVILKEYVKKDFDCWKWMLSWLEHYDQNNKTDIGSKIYKWIQEQPSQL